MKIKKKIGVGGSGGGVGSRIEVIGKIHTKNFGGGGGVGRGAQVGGRVGGGQGGCERNVGGRGWVGVWGM